MRRLLGLRIFPQYKHILSKALEDFFEETGCSCSEPFFDNSHLRGSKRPGFAAGVEPGVDGLSGVAGCDDLICFDKSVGVDFSVNCGVVAVIRGSNSFDGIGFSIAAGVGVGVCVGATFFNLGLFPSAGMKIPAAV